MIMLAMHILVHRRTKIMLIICRTAQMRFFFKNSQFTEIGRNSTNAKNTCLSTTFTQLSVLIVKKVNYNYC